MTVEPYCSARRVFWVVDNGSSHRGQASVDRLQGAWPNLTLVHLPVHASWLNQIEIYFSVVQRKVVSPNDITDLAEVEARLLAFERRYRRPRHRSTGASPDPTWTGCCAAWTTTSSSRGPHDHPGRTSGLRSCQVRVKTANRRDP